MSAANVPTWQIWMARMASYLFASLQHLKAAMLAGHGRSRIPRMTLVESLSLGNKRQLFLVVCDERRFLVGAGADEVGTLVAMQDADTLSATAGQSQMSHVPEGNQCPARASKHEIPDSKRPQLVKRHKSLHGDCANGAEAGRGKW